MNVIEKPRQAEVDHPDAEALIKEARQRQRRRWLLTWIHRLTPAIEPGERSRR